MPYIINKKRVIVKPSLDILSDIFEELNEKEELTAGDLNYIFTSLIKSYVHTKGKSYQSFNDVIGALEGCKLELYRREVGPYEDVKKAINGDY